MELWIRSQNRTDLIKVNALWVMDNQIWMEVPFYENHKKIGLSITGYNHKLAEYSTKERALEVLDEISSKIKNRYIVTTTTGITSKDEIANEYKRLDYLYSGEFIMENPPFEIKPINNDVIYYEMPKE
jgi:hypothetical protein